MVYTYGKAEETLSEVLKYTKDPVMSRVSDKIREACDILNGQEVDTILEWNPGNHFKEPDIRTAKAFAWVIDH